ncbi:uncharacterized protein N7446_004174 [Penicillium canescens]|uniref:Uncharacterized protein n=1 Tax=Penicillium canescens TaxID=5083 RepID=A0AAD6I1Q2_PENCN|nr:uncharacterized protein N7446_004174 [Penicillium canescens]KAJ6027226.1 hypothetical protein N7460_012043 [Penicillium canescens]KAJ6040508.1 hypothetical protein N7444_009413 [Penicillium canescens]KAJ6067137.1 hypothetical protein N7446_004174 [Penicillium canescens]
MQYSPQYPMFFATPQPVHQPPAQPLVRRFCILRPEGLWSPLIPLDELPSWLQVCNWTPDMHVGLYPVSMNFIPREGEYDVVCHNCFNSVDSLHQSVSERGPSSASSRATRAKTCPVQCYSPPKMQPETGTMATEFGVTYGILGQPPFHSMLQSPLVGMCLVDVHSRDGELAVVSDGVSQKMGVENSVPSQSSDQSCASAQSCPAHPPGPVNLCDSPLSFGSSRNLPERVSKAVISKRHSRPPHAHDDKWVGTPRRVLSLRDDSSASSHSAVAMAAALAKHMQRRRSRRISRTSSLHQSAIADADIVAPWTLISKAPSIRVRSKGRRRVRMRRQPAEEQRVSMSPSISPKSDNIVEVQKPKPEQPNAATKRRDRRERLRRRRNHTDRGSRYWHMMKIPNWRAGVIKH